jgi:uncharacterized RDD family membrane protein YckC
MEYEDRLTIATPEGVDLELTLAGVGSRFSSALVDYLIQFVILVALAVVLGVGLRLDPGAGGFALAVWVALSFLLFVGYDVSFEVLNSGRTPGKRLNGLRVVREDGSEVTLPTSAVRNVLRLVDILPGWYLVGMAAIVVSRRNQRLGDLAAGTLVVRDRKPLPRELRLPASTVPLRSALDTSAIGPHELEAVLAFLARRDDLTPDARLQVASELAARLRPKVGGPVGGETAELFLERLAVAKRGRP